MANSAAHAPIANSINVFFHVNVAPLAALRSQQFKSAATQLDQQRTRLQLANNSSNIFVIKMIISNFIAQSASHLAASRN